MGFESIDQPGRWLEVEHNPKMSISIFELERVGGWGLSPCIHIQLKLKFIGFLFGHKIRLYCGGGRLVKNTCWPQLFSIAFMFISINGGGGYIVQKQKCHLDLKSNFFILGGGTSSRTKMLRWPEIQLFPFLGGGGGEGTSAGRLVNFDSFSEIGYRTPLVFRMISEDQ